MSAEPSRPPAPMITILDFVFKVREREDASATQLIPPGTLEQWLPPRLIVDVPLNGFVESLLKIAARFPAQFTLRKRRIDRIPAVVAKSVGHKRNQAVRLAQFIENRFDHIDIHHLAVAAKIVNR